jgi:hypothetical protein
MPGEPASGEGLRHHIDGMSTAATDVRDIHAGAQSLRKAVGHRHNDVHQRGVEDLTAFLGHQRVEARVFAVGQPATVAEAADHLLLDLAEQRDELRDAGQVVGAGGSGKHRRTLARQGVRRRSRVVVDDPRGDDTAQPLPHVAFVQPGGVGDLLTGRRWQVGQRVEQPGLVSDGEQDRQARAVDGAHNPLGELLGRFGCCVLVKTRHVTDNGMPVNPVRLTVSPVPSSSLR